jgi:hypothetical protein
MTKAPVVSITVLVLFLVAGCRRGEPRQTVPEIYVPQQGAVSFDVTSNAPESNGPTTWTATYVANGKTARFQIELGATQPLSDDTSMRFGHGRFMAVDGSQSEELLNALKLNLEAKDVPKKVKRMHELSFDYAVLGRGMSQLKEGGFTGNPRGNWLVMKLFVAPKDSTEDAEVFLNLNPAMKKGEFAIKDPDYGDVVLAQLAKVL